MLETSASLILGLLGGIGTFLLAGQRLALRVQNLRRQADEAWRRKDPTAFPVLLNELAALEKDIQTLVGLLRSVGRRS